jgi:hypothetical protein
MLLKSKVGKCGFELTGYMRVEFNEANKFTVDVPEQVTAAHPTDKKQKIVVHENWASHLLQAYPSIVEKVVEKPVEKKEKAEK